MIAESLFKAATSVRVEVVAPARLHLGLLDLSAVGPRVDGGIGLTIEEPSLQVVAKYSSEPGLACPAELDDCCERVMKRLEEAGLSGSELSIEVHSDTKAHVGFGSGTQCSLAVASAISMLRSGSTPTVQQAALLTGRGGTSGIGVHAFAVGGFIVDGGHRWPEDKKELGPTRAFQRVPMPPLVARMDFPDWGVLVAVPRERKASSGQPEIDLFKSLVPMPLAEAEAACRIVLLGILPAIAQTDFSAFSSAIEEYRQLGMKRHQIKLEGSKFSQLRALIEEQGGRGVTVTCWGPAVVGFFPTVGQAVVARQQLTRARPDLHLIATRARNQGAVIRQVSR